MINTFVCTKEGCQGNKFRINTDEDNMIITCTECEQRYSIDISEENYKVLPSCQKCGKNEFKFYRDTNNGAIYFKCTECGGIPDKVYFDQNGNEVSYEQLRSSNLESRIEELCDDFYSLKDKVDDVGSKVGEVSNTLDYVYEWVANIRSKIDKL